MEKTVHLQNRDITNMKLTNARMRCRNHGMMPSSHIILMPTAVGLLGVRRS
jgi:hypothetical protein